MGVVATALLALPAAAQPWASDAAGAAGLAGPSTGFRFGVPSFQESFASGACWGDYDQDGWMDLYVTDLLGPGGAGLSRLYRNLGADGAGLRFQDETSAAGAGLRGVGHGCSWGDYDADGWPDLYVTMAVTNYSAQPHVLLRNTGAAFEDVTDAAGVSGASDDAYGPDGCGIEARTPVGPREACWGAGSAWIDFDLDGDLDLYVLHYAQYGHASCVGLELGGPQFCQGQPNRLYRNDGGTFTDVAANAGVALNAADTGGRSLGVIATDIDGDTWPDLWVANDMDGNALYINNRDGTFRDVAAARGLANMGPVKYGIQTYRAGMGVDAADIDNDGDLDLWSSHLHDQADGLWIAKGGKYRDRAASWGVGEDATGAASRWGGGLVDLDQDGWKDFIVVTGHPSDATPGPIHLLAGNGDEFRRPPLADWRWAAGDFGNYRAVAFADADNDGDLDAYVSALPDDQGRRQGRLLLFDGGANHWLRMDLVGNGNHPDAFGTRVEIRADGKTQTYTKASGGSFAASHDPRLLVGIGDATTATITITWPGGAREEHRVELDDALGDGASRPGLDLQFVEQSLVAGQFMPPPPAQESPGTSTVLVLVALAALAGVAARRTR